MPLAPLAVKTRASARISWRGHLQEQVQVDTPLNSPTATACHVHGFLAAQTFSRADTSNRFRTCNNLSRRRSKEVDRHRHSRLPYQHHQLQMCTAHSHHGKSIRAKHRPNPARSRPLNGTTSIVHSTTSSGVHKGPCSYVLEKLSPCFGPSIIDPGSKARPARVQVRRFVRILHRSCEMFAGRRLQLRGLAPSAIKHRRRLNLAKLGPRCPPALDSSDSSKTSKFKHKWTVECSKPFLGQGSAEELVHRHPTL